MWLLLPVVALAILGAYLAGKGFDNEPEAAPRLTANEQPVAATPPPPPPKGNITVTEMPHPTTVTPPPAPAPAPPVLRKPSPAPKPQRKQTYEQEEAPFVLNPPEPEPDENAPEIMPPEPPADLGSEPRPEEPPTSGEPDRDPVKLNDPALEYPSSAYEAGVEGTARISFTVNAEGRVDDAQVAQSSGDSRLDQAALDYVKRLRFRPAIRNGRPSDVRVNRNVRFQLR